MLAAICFCVIMLKKKTLKESKISQHMAAVSHQEEQLPQCEEVSLKGPHCEEIPVQNYHIYTLEPSRASLKKPWSAN